MNVGQRSWTRRRFMQIGALGFAGLNLADLLRAESASTGLQVPVKSCIVVYLYGGPSQLDTWDLKPDAPAEIRGEFRPIATRAPGVRIGEHLPHMARVMDRVAIVRSMHHRMRNHNAAAVESLCGRTPLRGDLELLGDEGNAFPCYGSVLSYLRTDRGAMPTHVALPHVMRNVVELPGQRAGFLGSAHNAMQVTSDPNAPDFRMNGLELPDDVSLGRLDDRRSLLRLVDRQIEAAEERAAFGTMDAFNERACSLLRSAAVHRAFAIEQEAPRLRDRFGRNKLGQSLLLARRLVESGVRFVNVHDKVTNGQLANWDSHQDNFGRLKNDLLPPADRGLSALIEDLHVRGLLESTLVVVLAEFGRTPKINLQAGRDHWPDCFSILLAGGGVQGGVAYGASDKEAAYPTDDPVTPGDLAATLFWRFGIDPTTIVRDLTGRPWHLADGEPLRKLFQ